MQITLFEHDSEHVHTSIVAILEFGRLTVSGVDHYYPNEAVKEPSEYEYETLLDSISTKELFDLLCPNGSETECLNALSAKFSGEGADIRFQAYCFSNDIETDCQSRFDD